MDVRSVDGAGLLEASAALGALAVEVASLAFELGFGVAAVVPCPGVRWRSMRINFTMLIAVFSGSANAGILLRPC